MNNAAVPLFSSLGKKTVLRGIAKVNLIRFLKFVAAKYLPSADERFDGEDPTDFSLFLQILLFPERNSQNLQERKSAETKKIMYMT